MLIVIEGIDGAGTTTQASRLVAALTAEGRDAHLTREQLRARQKEHRAGVKKLDRTIAELHFCEAAALVREASRRAQAHRQRLTHGVSPRFYLTSGDSAG